MPHYEDSWEKIEALLLKLALCQLPADVMKAVVTAGEAAIRKLRPGVNNSEVAKAIGRVAEDFGVRVVEGVLSHNMKRYVIDGNKVILNKPSAELKADEAEIKLNEVYALDIVMSSGEGTPKMLDEKETAVYKRAVENNYKLKQQNLNEFSEIGIPVSIPGVFENRHTASCSTRIAPGGPTRTRGRLSHHRADLSETIKSRTPGPHK